MRHRLRQVARPRGVQAAAATIAACGVLGIVGAAEGAEDQQVLGKDDLTFAPNEITVQTGDTVTWAFDGAQQPHNAQNDPERESTGADVVRWEQFSTSGPNFEFNKPGSFRFLNPGTYYFVCIVHVSQNMTGVIRVEGEPVEETPTPTPSATVTATATATATPTATATATPNPAPDDHTTTPPPGGVSASDAVAPTLTGIRTSGRRGLAKVRFKLSETSTVTLRVKKRKKVVRTARVQVAAGTRTVKVRSAKLKRGRYRIELQARDAVGNTTKVLTAKLRIKRK